MIGLRASKQLWLVGTHGLTHDQITILCTCSHLTTASERPMDVTIKSQEFNRILFAVSGITFLLMSLGKRHLSVIL